MATEVVVAGTPAASRMTSTWVSRVCPSPMKLPEVQAQATTSGFTVVASAATRRSVSSAPIVRRARTFASGLPTKDSGSTGPSPAGTRKMTASAPRSPARRQSSL